ncbi:unnamed protein product [Caenorhabditis brenneri]
MSNNLQNPPLDRDTVTQLGKTIRGEFPKFQSAMRFEVKIQHMKQEAQDANVPVELSRADMKRVNTRKFSLHMFSMAAKKFSMEDHPPSGEDSRIHGIAHPQPRPPREIGHPYYRRWIPHFYTMPPARQEARLNAFRREREEARIRESLGWPPASPPTRRVRIGEFRRSQRNVKRGAE